MSEADSTNELHREAQPFPGTYTANTHWEAKLLPESSPHFLPERSSNDKTPAATWAANGLAKRIDEIKDQEHKQPVAA